MERDDYSTDYVKTKGFGKPTTVDQPTDMGIPVELILTILKQLILYTLGK